jgi:glycosyltransferase involved in cell wall biosynthesis
MGFASEYLRSGALFPKLFSEEPGQDTGLIVVIPAWNEPEIYRCLSSLAACRQPDTGVEVIIIVNAPPSATGDKSEVNKETVESINSWKRENQNPLFRLFVFDAGQPDIKGWGVGTARKTGMDEAVRRFNHIDNRDGVIVSLDADCVVEPGYFVALWNDFGLNRGAGGCSLYFEHRIDEMADNENLVSAISQYELHLRYFVAALRFVGFPYPFHTIGSAMAVKAGRYVKAGGMNRRQGGEDFYFIHKLVAGDDYFSLNSTTVYPSARLSLRVPFGTGPVISQLLNSGQTTYYTYNPDSLIPLREFFEQMTASADSGNLSGFEPGIEISAIIAADEWREKHAEIKKNTASPQMFTKRFFTWFNAFKIVKYLNAVHLNQYGKVPVNEAAARLLMMSGCSVLPESTAELLDIYRKIDRET